MKILFKSLLVWLLMLALPLQGVASATMLPCAPQQQHAAMHDTANRANMADMADMANGMNMSAPRHDHQKMLAAKAAARAAQPAVHHVQSIAHGSQGAAVHGSGGDAVATSHHDGSNAFAAGHHDDSNAVAAGHHDDSNAVAAGHHDDSNAVAAGHHVGSTAVATSHHDGTTAVAASHHDGSKCTSCAACCPANLMSNDLRVAADSPRFAVAPFITGFVPVVDLALPERPPQTILI